MGERDERVKQVAVVGGGEFGVDGSLVCGRSGAPRPRWILGVLSPKVVAWGREIGEGRRTGVGICGVPTFLPTVPGRLIVGHSRMGLGASVEKCFRVVELWGNIPVIPVVTVWAADPEANRSRSVVAMPKSSASLRCRISNTHPVAGGCRLHKMLAGKGAKGSAVVARPQRRMQAI
jgi:hypothetical protein